MNLINKTLKYLVISIIGITALSLLIIFLNEQNHKFSKRKWEHNPQKRYQYSEDLVKKRLLINKSEREVIDLLGEPTNKYDSLNYWRYQTGIESVWINEALYFLYINWHNEKVISAKVDTIIIKF